MTRTHSLADHRPALRLSWGLSLGLAIAALALMPAPAPAQGFNDAPPNAPDQRPAFDGQTRAPVMADDIALVTQVVAGGLAFPWGMAELPDGGWLVTERAGRLLVVRDGTARPVAGVPAVAARGQGGLLDVALAPDFAQTRQIWLTLAEDRGDGRNATALAHARLADDDSRLDEARIVWQQNPAVDSGLHFGSRIVPDGAGGLFVTTGDRGHQSAQAQDGASDLGKVIHIAADGTARHHSRGHRNIQAAALDATGALWTVEHGPRGGDELNRPQTGGNYGWPVISYGINYDGSAVGQGLTAAAGMEQPVYYWYRSSRPRGWHFTMARCFPNGAAMR